MTTFTKLAIFDFDGTLVNTPLPETGKLHFQKKTGKEWPHKGWWGREESLDHKIFDMPSNPLVITDYEKERATPETGVIMLTGRLQHLADHVRDILDIKGLTFDGHHFNKGGATEIAKVKTLNKLLDEHQSVTSVEMWDDRLEHIPVFEAWGKEKCLSGRLTDFKINFVLSDNHGK